jgi:hypothetical protein
MRPRIGLTKASLSRNCRSRSEMNNGRFGNHGGIIQREGSPMVVNSLTAKGLGGLVALLSITVSLTGCYSASSQSNPAVQSKLALQTEELEKLKSAEYQDYMNAMDFEESNRNLGNYYAAKAVQVHGVIDEMEQGQPVDDVKISRALDDSDSSKYDNARPAPLDDETGRGH